MELDKKWFDTSTLRNYLPIVLMVWYMSMVTMSKPIIPSNIMLITCATKSFHNQYFRYDI